MKYPEILCGFFLFVQRKTEKLPPAPNLYLARGVMATIPVMNV
jgi:hypothetical protein